MNYGELRSQFQGLLHRRDLTTTLRDTFLQQSIQRVQRTLRIPAMEASLAVTMDETYGGLLPIPGDLLELKSIVFNDYVLQQRDLTSVLEGANNSGYPLTYARAGSLWVLAPAPTLGIIGRVDYYANFSPLSTDADSNPLSEIAPDVIIYGALSYACDYYLDKRGPNFESRFQQALAELQTQADLDELSGASVVSSAYQFDQD